MLFYELTIVGVLKKDIEFKNMNEELSKIINKAFLNDEKLKEFHELNTFKMYVFSGFQPIEINGYKKGNMYSFKLRSMDRVFALNMRHHIKNTENDLLDIVTIGFESISYRPINELYTLTPCISVIENRKHWINSDYEIDLIKDRINSNIQRKYKMWFGEEIDKDHDFIDSIEQKNNSVIVLNYKEGKLLTNKFKITIKKDEISQRLAFLILGTGLLEKNSLGLGFCTAR